MTQVSPTIWGPCSHFLLRLGEAPLSFTSSPSFPHWGYTPTPLHRSYANAPVAGHWSVGSHPVPQRAQRLRGWAGRHPSGSGGKEFSFQAPRHWDGPLGLLRTQLQAARAVALCFLRGFEGICEAKSARRPVSTHPSKVKHRHMHSLPHLPSPLHPPKLQLGLCFFSSCLIRNSLIHLANLCQPHALSHWHSHLPAETGPELHSGWLGGLCATNSVQEH